jgi:hypothetical protein
MSALRLLALSYLAAASVFTLTGALQARPELWRGLAQGAHDLSDRVTREMLNPALERLRRHDVVLLDSLDRPAVARLAIAPIAPGEERLLARQSSAPVEPRALEPADARLAESEFLISPLIEILPDLPPEEFPPEPKLVTPRAPRASAPDIRIAKNTARQVAPAWRIPEPPPPEAPVGNRAMAASLRLKAGLTQEMLNNFDLFLYVSKAERGPLAQRMYVFRKNPGDTLALAYDWAASTGREKSEVSPRGRPSFTATPQGYYQLDPLRMYRRYRSYSWDQPMPNAMFFNWERQGLKTGLAIHAAHGENIAKLGQRNSAGCIHLSPENAETLQDLIRANYRGPVPRFAYNAATRTMSNKGAFMHDREGRLKMTDGYRVLVYIEDYGGRDMVAALF